MTMTYTEQVAAERAKRQAREDRLDALRKSLPALGRDVALALGKGWSVSQAESWRVDLSGPNGLILSIHAEHGLPDHVVIYGVFPRSVADSGAYVGNIKRGEIKVRADRGAATIAKEIMRRLMPVYVPALAEALKRTDERLDDAATRDAVAAEIAALMRAPAAARYRHGDGPGASVYVSHGDVRVEVRPGGYIRAEISGQVNDKMRAMFAAFGGA